MSNPYIIFNGVSSEDLGFVIEKLPDMPRPKRNIEETEIPGRDGSLITDLGGYACSQIKLTINPFGHPITDVYGWLQGEGWLTTSDDPEYMRWVAFYDVITDSRFRADGRCYDSLSVAARAWPYKHLVAQQAIEVSEPQVFQGQGNAPSLPVIELTGVGSVDLMVNDASVLIEALDGTIILDCDARTAYTEIEGVKTFAGRQVTLAGEWPQLLPAGEITNRINWSGSVERVKINPWWRWL